MRHMAGRDAQTCGHAAPIANRRSRARTVVLSACLVAAGAGIAGAQRIPPLRLQHRRRPAPRPMADGLT